jgi:hypothetical protein
MGNAHNPMRTREGRVEKVPENPREAGNAVYTAYTFTYGRGSPEIARA